MSLSTGIYSLSNPWTQTLTSAFSLQISFFLSTQTCKQWYWSPLLGCIDTQNVNICAAPETRNLFPWLIVFYHIGMKLRGHDLARMISSSLTEWIWNLLSKKKNRVNNSLHLWSEEISFVEEWISLDSNSSRVKLHSSTSGITSGSIDIHSKRSDHWRHYPGSDVS